ncbi:hypothetical protein D3C80_1280800 [compost metagenome]
MIIVGLLADDLGDRLGLLQLFQTGGGARSLGRAARRRRRGLGAGARGQGVQAVGGVRRRARRGFQFLDGKGVDGVQHMRLRRRLRRRGGSGRDREAGLG